MIDEGQQITGYGELWCGAEHVLGAVHYRLDLLEDGSVGGQITAPPSARLAPFVSSTPHLTLLRTSSGRFIACEIRVYQRRPGGSAQIAGHILPPTVAIWPAIAA